MIQPNYQNSNQPAISVGHMKKNNFSDVENRKDDPEVNLKIENHKIKTD